MDTYQIYSTIFPNQLWISEGIKSLVKNYCSSDQKIETNQKIAFLGTNATEVDSDVCQYFQIDTQTVPYLQLLNKDDYSS